MGMLDRIKRRQIDGFKDFVINMETTGGSTRGQIFTAGVLEDPIYMNWVMKNIKTFDDFLQISSDDIEKVLTNQDQILPLFAKCVFDFPQEKLLELESTIPRLIGRLKDELSFISEVTPQEREGARYYILKLVRKLQIEERIYGFPWNLPPQEIYYPKVIKDGSVKIHFESGVLAAEGEYLKGKRTGFWHHNYETGKILAEGDYIDGLKNNVWVFYYSNGNIKAQGKYRGDLKHGLWKEWSRNGELTEIEYDEGVKVVKK